MFVPVFVRKPPILRPVMAAVPQAAAARAAFCGSSRRALRPGRCEGTNTDISTQHTEPIFRHPNQMIFAIPHRVAAALVRFHPNTRIGRDPKPPKGVLFPDPLSGTLKVTRKFRLSSSQKAVVLTDGPRRWKTSGLTNCTAHNGAGVHPIEIQVFT